MWIQLKKNIVFLKNLNKLSNEEIAEATGIGKKFANYAVGKNDPPIPNLIKIAQFFDVSIDKLLLTDMESENKINTLEEPLTPYNVKQKLKDMEIQIRNLQELIKKKNDK